MREIVVRTYLLDVDGAAIRKRIGVVNIMLVEPDPVISSSDVHEDHWSVC